MKNTHVKKIYPPVMKTSFPIMMKMNAPMMMRYVLVIVHYHNNIRKQYI